MGHDLKLVEIVTGYINGYSKVLDQYGITSEDLDEFLANENIEECPTCGWYVPAYERIPKGEDEPDNYCDNCR